MPIKNALPDRPLKSYEHTTLQQKHGGTIVALNSPYTDGITDLLVESEKHDREYLLLFSSRDSEWHRVATIGPDETVDDYEDTFADFYAKHHEDAPAEVMGGE
jgi:hypothetical protein